MSDEDNKALVRRFYNEFYGRKNTGAMDDAFAAGYVHHIPDVLDGKMDFNDYKKHETQRLEAFEDFSREIEDQVAEGDRVVTRSVLRGTQTGDLPNFPARGRKIEVQSIVINRIEDGKIAEGWESYDSLGMMMQLDVVHMVSTLGRARHMRGDVLPHMEWPE
ncbi:MAG: SnoaL-like polyketide cyclase [Methanocella sp. PtaU1.Bin125]|nr:MAG: SnoaL-like polyketide cyclase [Methanocella sp. PtaU1.Bin125]